MIKAIFCIACSLLFLVPATAQDFIYKQYGLRDGLPDPTIHSIFQDADGFLWIGTESGLCRYDGKQFKTFTVKDGLADNEVFGMVQDRKGRIWFYQYSHSIGYIYKGKIFNQQNDPFLKKIRLQTRVTNIVLDRDGNIGFCDALSMFVVDPEMRSLRTFGLGKRPLHAITMGVDTSGQFIISTLYGVFRLEKQDFRYIMTIGPPTELTSNTVLFNKNYMMYGAYNRRRKIYLKDTVVTIDLPADFTIKYSAVAKNMVSVNTVDGAFLFNTDTYKMLHLLPGIKVTNVLFDREKNLWIGTMGKGLYKLSSQSVINKRISDAANNICYITREGNKIIAGNDNAELFEYTGNQLTKINIARYREATPWKMVYHEKLDNGASILFNAGWCAIQKNGKALKQRKVGGLKQVKKMDDRHYLVTGVGVFIVSKNDLAFDTIWKKKGTAALITGDSMLVGTLNGLFIFRKEHEKYRLVDSILASSAIFSIEKAPGNLLWIGTINKGLYYFRDGKIARYFTDTSGLPGNNIRSMFINGNDTWVGTDHGLVKISFKEGNFHLRKFSTSDGLVSDIINYIYIEGDTVYLGTPEGLCYFNESAIETSSVCNLVLTGITVGSTPVALSDEYHTGRNQRIVVEYSGISFRSEQQMTYRYRTRGAVDDWQYTNRNTLEYASLPYGTYQLEIVAINKFGKESLPVRITFIIDRPFYSTTWFIAGCIVLLMALVLFFFSRYARTVKRKQVQKLQQEIKIMELEQMALRAQMNPHFIFNCISAMQQLVTEGNEQNTQLFITNFSNLVRQTLENATELFISLEEEIKFLTSYFELERIRAEDRFSYTIDTPGIPDFAHLAVPNMVIQPFIENAIRHGIRYKKNGAGLIRVTFTSRDGTLSCTVADNGIGRRKSAELQKKFGANHHSKGMGITFKRIESLNTLTGRDIEIGIEDLVDKIGEPAGTKVSITFHNNPGI